MSNSSRLRLSATGIAMVAAAIAVAQNNSTASAPSSAQPSASTPSSSTAGRVSSLQPGVTNPSNLPSTGSATTEQQSKAPVVDPEVSAREAANAKADATRALRGEATSAANSNTQNSATQQWPAQQRYEADRSGSDSTSGQRRASLGVNIVRSEDGRGLLVVRIRQGTPADQMGLRPQDRILNLNGRPVTSPDEFISAIRGMKPGEQIELSIDRDGSVRNVGGKLEALRESIAEGEGPVANIVGRAREFVDRDRSARFGQDGRAGNENIQTNYVDESPNGRTAGNLEARLIRVEQAIDQLMRDVSEIRTSIRPNPSVGSALPNAGSAVQPGTPEPSALPPTPGQPPSGQQPQNR